MSLADGTPVSSGPWLRAGGRIFGVETAPFLLPLLHARRGRIALLFLLGLVGAGAALVPPWMTKLVIDLGLVAGDPAALVTWSLALFGFGLLALGLGALSSILHMRASVGMLADLRAVLIAEVLTRPPHWRARHQTGELMARIDGDAAEVQQFAFNAFLTGSGAVVKLLGGAVLLLVLNWQLALLAFCLAPLELLFFAHARPRTEKLAAASRQARGEFAGGLGELLAGLSSLRAIGAEPAMKRRMASAQGDLNRRLISARLWSEVTRAVPQVLSALVRMAVFIVGGLSVIRGDWPLGSLIAFLAYLGFLTGPTQSLIGLWHAQARVKVALGRIGTLLQFPAGDHPAPLVRGTDTTGPGLIEFDAVRHPHMAEPVSACIPAGSACLVAGASGVGKSSLLSLLLRQDRPAEGTIRLDGVDIARLDRAALRNRITFVPQRAFILKASVAENLRLCSPEADDALLLDRLAMVGLEERFGAGNLDMVIGESGLSLSGGERQRLCVARALVSPKGILVLDEALGEVDPDTTVRIMSGIRSRWPHMTLLVTTHRAATEFGAFHQALTVGRG